jgi:hypothetical protein
LTPGFFAPASSTFRRFRIDAKIGSVYASSSTGISQASRVLPRSEMTVSHVFGDGTGSTSG